MYNAFWDFVWCTTIIKLQTVSILHMLQVQFQLILKGKSAIWPMLPIWPTVISTTHSGSTPLNLFMSTNMPWVSKVQQWCIFRLNLLSYAMINFKYCLSYSSVLIYLKTNPILFNLVQSIWSLSHPSAENLITLGHEHHDGTTCHMNLWQKVSVSVKTESP